MGSLQESALLLYLIQKDRVEHEVIRVLVQGQVNAEAASKAFEEYVKIRYPYLETAKHKEKEQVVAQLLAEVSRGPVVVKPVSTGSDLKSRLRRKAGSDTNVEGAKSVAKKIGRSVPL